MKILFLFNKIRMKVNIVSYIAEFIGTFILILSIFASGGNAIIIGATLFLIVLLTGGVSNGMVNPAVSLAMFMNGTIKTNELFIYIFVQMIGGISAFYAYNALKA